MGWPASTPTAWGLPVLGLTVLFLAGNLSLQYGAARLAANRTSVVMLTEVCSPRLRRSPSAAAR
jgi:hypothetical protein